MIYDEQLPVLSKSTLTLQVSDFSNGINTKISQNVLPQNYAVNSYNFSYSSGSLRDGLGLRELVVPTTYGTTKSFVTPTGVTKILNVWHFRRYNRTLQKFEPFIVIYTSDGSLYFGVLENSETNFYPINDFTLNANPIGINYRIEDTDCLLLCSPDTNDSFTVWDGVNVPYEYQDAPDITSAVLYAGRLFVTTGGDKSQLWFSDDLDPRNWNVNEFEGGYIELTDERGQLNKLIESNNYLYIIREYGISRMSAWGEQTDFTVRNLYLSTGKIYSNSAVLCGSNIIMLCRDGLYNFDGVEMTKICSNLDGYFDGVDNENAVGAFLDGKYYLACRLNFGDEAIGCELNADYVNNALIEFDINNGEINIMRGVDISVMRAFQTSLFSKLVILLNTGTTNKLYELTRDGKIVGTNTKKVWCSPFSDLGYPSNQKALKHFYINTKKDMFLTISTENKKYRFEIKGSEAITDIPLNIRCKKFSFTVETDEVQCDISNPVIQMYVL